MRAPTMFMVALLFMSIGLAANAQDYQAYITYPGGYGLTINQRATLEGAFSSEGTSAVPFTADFTSAANPNAPSPYSLNSPFSVYCIDINHGQYNDIYDTVTVAGVPGLPPQIRMSPPLRLAKLPG